MNSTLRTKQSKSSSLQRKKTIQYKQRESLQEDLSVRGSSLLRRTNKAKHQRNASFSSCSSSSSSSSSSQQSPSVKRLRSQIRTSLKDCGINARRSKALPAISLFCADEEQIYEPASSNPVDGYEQAVQSLQKPSTYRHYSDLTHIEKATSGLQFFRYVREKQGEASLHQLFKFMQYEEYQVINSQLFIQQYLNITIIANQAEQTVFSLGTLGDKFYVILKGEVGVHIYQQISVPEENSTKCKIENRLILINTLLTGDSFGELALLGVQRRRTATIICRTQCHFATLHKKYYERILARGSREQIEAKIAFISTLPYLRELSPRAQSTLSYHFEEIRIRRGEALYREGEKATHVYVIREGEVRIEQILRRVEEEEPIILTQRQAVRAKQQQKQLLQQSQKQQQAISILHRGDILGNEDFSSNSQQNGAQCVAEVRRSHSAVCESGCAVLLRMHYSAYLQRIASMLNNPQGAEALRDILNSRQVAWQQRVQRSSDALARHINFLIPQVKGHIKQNRETPLPTATQTRSHQRYQSVLFGNETSKQLNNNEVLKRLQSSRNKTLITEMTLQSNLEASPPQMQKITQSISNLGVSSSCSTSSGSVLQALQKPSVCDLQAIVVKKAFSNPTLPSFTSLLCSNSSAVVKLAAQPRQKLEDLFKQKAVKKTRFNSASYQVQTAVPIIKKTEILQQSHRKLEDCRLLTESLEDASLKERHLLLKKKRASDLLQKNNKMRERYEKVVYAIEGNRVLLSCFTKKLEQKTKVVVIRSGKRF